MSNREFVKLSPAFWNGQTGRQLRRAGLEAQLVALYLISSPHANYLGLYSLPLAYIAADTGLSLDAVQAALGKIEQTGFARYDHSSETVWVINAAAQQIGELRSGDNRIKFAQKAFDAVPSDCPFKIEFQAKYVKALGLGAPAAKAPAPKQAELVPTAQPASAPTLDPWESTFFENLYELMQRRARHDMSGDGEVHKTWLQAAGYHGYEAAARGLRKSLAAGDLDEHAVSMHMPHADI